MLRNGAKSGSLLENTFIKWNVLANIWTGKEAGQSVNVYKAAELGPEKTIDFQEDFLVTFRKPLATTVVLMTWAKDKQTKYKNNNNKENQTKMSIIQTFYSHVLFFF